MPKDVKYYTKIMDELIRSNKLTPNEKAVLSVLISYSDCDKIYLKQSTIAKQSNMSRDTVNRVIKSLRKGRYIKTVEIPDRSNLEYEVLYGKVTADSDRGYGLNRQGGTANSDSSIKSISIKSIDKEKIPYKEIIEYLIKVSGRKFNHKSKAAQKLIAARWNEGGRLPEFKKVIDNYHSRFKGTEFYKYMQPSTLFNGKFDERLNWVIEEENTPTTGARRIIQ